MIHVKRHLKITRDPTHSYSPIMAKARRPRSKGKPPARLDVYEAEEEVPAEEKFAGQRYDNIENYEYELPSEFEDEEIDEDAAFTEEDKKLYAGWFEGTEAAMAAGGNAAPDDGLLDSQDDAEDGEDAYNTDDFSEEEDPQAAQEPNEEGSKESDEGSEDDEEEEEDMEEGDGDQEQHARMLAEVRAAGRPAGARRPREVQTESVPERALNVGPMTDLPGGQAGELQISDLLGALGKGKGRNALDARSRRTLERVEKRSAPVEPSLPATIRAKKQRQAGYEVSTKDVSKWQSIVKANREAPTLKFAAGNEDVPRTSTTGALIAKFQPSRDFEKEIAAMLAAAGAHNEQAVQEAEEALALKGQSVEEARARRDHLAKMRSLLFHQEAKLKHLAKIKSKDYHRRAQKAARAKAKKAGEMGDADFLRLAAEEAELQRAKERLTLKHRNTSQWARRALRRGINVMDEGTKEAIQEQLRMGQELRRKVEAPGSGSDMGSDAEDSATDASEDEGDAPKDLSKPSRAAIAKAKAAAMDIMQNGEGEDDAPAKGLFALPFMRRAQEKRRAQAQAEAAAMLRDMEAADACAELDSSDEAANWAAAEPTAGHGGRLRFGGAGQQQHSHLDDKADSEAEDSDLDEDAEAKAERLGSRVEPQEGVLPASASGWTAAGADAPAASAKRDRSLQLQKYGKISKQDRKLERREQAQQTVLANGSAQKGGLLQSGSASAEAAGIAREPGHEAYRPDILAHVARKQREHLLDANIGASMQNGAAEQPRGKQMALPASLTAGQEDGNSSGQAPFIQAAKFRGLKEGYVFKTGPRGTGYYQEGHLNGEKQSSKAGGAHELLSKASSKAKPRQTAQEQAGGDQEDDGNMKPLKGTELSQRELIARAFAGDDVQAEFDEAKGREAEEEAPKADAPSLLPGWGAWAGHQKTPGWMAKAQDKAQRQRQEAIARRKDAKLAHVIISERYDKKASKYGTPSVPFPYNAKEVYERSMRQPLGRDYNTDSSFRNLTRPKILKTPGVVIEPLKYNKAADKDAARLPANNAQRKSMAVVSNGMRKQSKV